MLEKFRHLINTLIPKTRIISYLFKKRPIKTYQPFLQFYLGYFIFKAKFKTLVVQLICVKSYSTSFINPFDN